ncbi:MAG: tetratricopeptide repeat protein [Cyanobacteria bacterium J06635_15]
MITGPLHLGLLNNMTGANHAPQIFVCYARKDNDSPNADQRWLDRLLEHLKPLEAQQGLAFWSDQQIETGSDWQQTIQSILKTVKAAVLLISPSFLNSSYIRNSELPVLLQRAKEDGVLILPLILRPCLLEAVSFRFPDPQLGPGTLSLASLQGVNTLNQPLNGLSQVEQDRVLVSVARRLLKLTTTPPTTAARSSVKNTTKEIWNVPYERNTFFTGREKVLQNLSKRLTQNSEVALSQTQAISGLGGIGKTQTVVEYAYRHREDYRAIFWVRAETELEVSISFIEIARLLDLPEQNASDPYDAIQAVKHWMEVSSGWLLIFDNADRPEQIKSFRPCKGQGHILLTSRAQTFDVLGISKPVSLEKMSAEEAEGFLFKRTGRPVNEIPERAAATALAAELGYLPLALEQAGAYILAKQISFEDYLKSYRKRKLLLLQKAWPVVGNYPESVATTWALNFQAVENYSKAAGELLRVSAFLNPDEIPYEVFEKGAGALGNLLAEALANMADDPVVFSDVLAPLIRYSLIQTDPGLRTYSIARLVQEVVKDELDEESRRRWAKCTIGALTQAFPISEYSNWLQCERLLPHATAATHLAHRYHIESETAALLFYKTGYYLDERARFKDAEHLLLNSLRMRQQLLGDKHPDIATSLHNLAALYYKQNRYDEAEPLSLKALTMRKQILGHRHPDVANSLNNLAALYDQQGRCDEAEPLFLEALEIQKQLLGNQDPCVASSLSNLAMLYKEQSRFDKAEPLLLEAINICKQLFDGPHPYVGRFSDNLASLYRAQGNREKAKRTYVEALEILEQTLGTEHAWTLRCRKNLETLLKKTKRLPQIPQKEETHEK